MLKIIVMIQENLEELPIAAHSKCSLNYSVQKEIPIIIHNASYDTHFMLNQLALEFKGDLNCIGDNIEKYIIFSVPI